jgi:hypothetical protein
MRETIHPPTISCAAVVPLGASGCCRTGMGRGSLLPISELLRRKTRVERTKGEKTSIDWSCTLPLPPSVRLVLSDRLLKFPIFAQWRLHLHTWACGLRFFYRPLPC